MLEPRTKMRPERSPVERRALRSLLAQPTGPALPQLPHMCESCRHPERQRAPARYPCGRQSRNSTTYWGVQSAGGK